MTLTYDLDFQSPVSYGNDPKTNKISSSRSAGSKDIVEKRTDTTDRITFAAKWAVEIYFRFSGAETHRSENKRID